MSLDAVEVDLSKSFERGMGYVALSRVRSLEGLRLIGLNKNALEVRGDVMEFDEDLRERSADDKKWLYYLTDKQIKEKQKEFLDKVVPLDGATKKTAKRRISPIDETKNLLKERMGIKEILNVKGIKIGTLLDHVEKILEKDPEFDINHLRDEVAPGKFKKAWMTFKELYGENREFLLSPIKNKLGEGYTYEDLRIVRLFVKKSIN